MDTQFIVVVDDDEKQLRTIADHITSWATPQELQVVSFTTAERAQEFVEQKRSDVRVFVCPQQLQPLSGIDLFSNIHSISGQTMGVVHGDGSLTEQEIPVELDDVLWLVTYAVRTRTVAREARRAARYWELLRQAEHMKHQAKEDLDSAFHFQQELLRVQPPDIPGLSIALHNRPSRERLVGGDYFDFFKLSPAKVLLCFGDVAGVGLKPAFVSAVLKNIIYHEYVRLFDPTRFDPAGLLTWLNQRLIGFFQKFPDLFLSFSATVIDTRDMKARFANAGQPALVLVRTNEAVPLSVAGIPLGIQSDSEYASREVALAGGMQLVWMSDGLFALDLGGSYAEMSKPEVMYAFRSQFHDPGQVVETLVENRSDPDFRPDDITLITARVL